MSQLVNAMPDRSGSKVNSPANITRREFLYYVWAGSMVLAMGGSVAAATLFAMPRWSRTLYKLFLVSSDRLPKSGEPPMLYAPMLGEPEIWLVNHEDKLYAHANICTHLKCRCLVWDESAKIFNCPSHGTQYSADGSYRAGPAPRGLDRYEYSFVNHDQREIASTYKGEPLNLAHYANAVGVQIYPDRLLMGKLRS